MIEAVEILDLEVEDDPLGHCEVGEAQIALNEIAANHRIPVAQVSAEFMGANRLEDSQDRGLVRSDRRHTTSKGARLIAEMLGDLGFDLAA